jgi:PiT family inorganic phosphate transporter
VELFIVIIVILTALVFDYINGFHDAANSIATVVSTRVLTPGQAVVWAAFFNFAAAFFFGTEVAHTVGAGMVNIEIVTYAVIMAGLLGAIVWDLITWYYGLPTSSSHALIGGYAGAAIAKVGYEMAIIPSGWTKTLVFIVLSPLIGFVVSFLLMVAILWIFRGSAPTRVDHWFRRLQLISAAAYSLNHGANHGHHCRRALRRKSDSRVQDRSLGRAGGPRRHRAWHALRRLAHHPHDGSEDYAAPAGGWVCR